MWPKGLNYAKVQKRVGVFNRLKFSPTRVGYTVSRKTIGDVAAKAYKEVLNDKVSSKAS
jgi:hypothetical protein